jgi:hypothetical protein
MDDATLTVTLELRIDGEFISGRVIPEDGESLDFDGWLGLLAALDSLVPATSDVTPGRES